MAASRNLPSFTDQQFRSGLGTSSLTGVVLEFLRRNSSMLGILPMNWESDRYRPRDSLVAGNVDRRGNLDSAQTLEERLEVVEERRRSYGKKLFRNGRDPDQIRNVVLCCHSPLPNPLPSNNLKTNSSPRRRSVEPARRAMAS